MAILTLDTDALLTTTRAVRKRLDFERGVEMEVIEECLDLALQAPSGSNAQGWHFVLVTDGAKRKAVGDIYARAFDAYRSMPASAHAIAQRENEAHRGQMERVTSSAEYLAANLGRVPVHLIPCLEGRVDGMSGAQANLAQASFFGSILPAVWSFMLAARSRGLGTAWTTLHLMFEKEAAEILSIPYDRITQAALVPVAYSKGTSFNPAERKPLAERLHTNRW